jgi:putative transposase
MFIAPWNVRPTIGYRREVHAQAQHGRPDRPQSATWATFLRTHVAATLAIDFLTVPTVSFNVLYVFFALSLERRGVLHVNVTAHPHAAWAAQQVVDAVGVDATLNRVIRNHDGIYGKIFGARVQHMGVECCRRK